MMRKISQKKYYGLLMRWLAVILISVFYSMSVPAADPALDDLQGEHRDVKKAIEKAKDAANKEKETSKSFIASANEYLSFGMGIIQLYDLAKQTAGCNIAKHFATKDSMPHCWKDAYCLRGDEWVLESVFLPDLDKKTKKGICRLDKPEDPEAEQLAAIEAAGLGVAGGLGLQRPDDSQDGEFAHTDTDMPDAEAARRMRHSALMGGHARGPGFERGGVPQLSGDARDVGRRRDDARSDDITMRYGGAGGYPGSGDTRIGSGYGDPGGRLDAHETAVRRPAAEPEEKVPVVTKAPEKTLFDMVGATYQRYQPQYDINL